MGMVRYAIVRQGDHWAIDESGVVGGDYLSREAAFETAAAAASNLLKIGDGVSIVVEEPAPGEPALGTPE